MNNRTAISKRPSKILKFSAQLIPLNKLFPLIQILTFSVGYSVEYLSNLRRVPNGNRHRMRGAEGIQREDEEDVTEAFRVEEFPGLFEIGLVIPLKIKRVV